MPLSSSNYHMAKGIRLGFCAIGGHQDLGSHQPQPSRHPRNTASTRLPNAKAKPLV